MNLTAWVVEAVSVRDFVLIDAHVVSGESGVETDDCRIDVLTFPWTSRVTRAPGFPCEPVEPCALRVEVVGAWSSGSEFSK